MKDKPTLEDLFNSKKLDLPDEDFWNGFQDRVKGQAIASLSQRSRTARLRKAGAYSVLPVLVLSLIGWNLLSSEVSVSSGQAVAVGNAEAVITTDSLAQLESLMLQEDSLNREGAVQLARLDSFDSEFVLRLVTLDHFLISVPAGEHLLFVFEDLLRLRKQDAEEVVDGLDERQIQLGWIVPFHRRLLLSPLDVFQVSFEFVDLALD